MKNFPLPSGICFFKKETTISNSTGLKGFQFQGVGSERVAFFYENCWKEFLFLWKCSERLYLSNEKVLSEFVVSSKKYYLRGEVWHWQNAERAFVLYETVSRNCSLPIKSSWEAAGSNKLLWKCSKGRHFLMRECWEIAFSLKTWQGKFWAKYFSSEIMLRQTCWVLLLHIWEWQKGVDFNIKMTGRFVFLNEKDPRNYFFLWKRYWKEAFFEKWET